MKNKNSQMPTTETMDRYCPICGIFIKLGSTLHHCDIKILEAIDKQRDFLENKIIELPTRTYNNRFKEAEPFIDPDYFYEEIENDDNSKFYEI